MEKTISAVDRPPCAAAKKSILNPMAIVIRPMDIAKSPTAKCMILTGPLLTINRTFAENSATMPVMKLIKVNANAITPEIDETYND